MLALGICFKALGVAGSRQLDSVVIQHIGDRELRFDFGEVHDEF